MSGIFMGCCDAFSMIFEDITVLVRGENLQIRLEMSIEFLSFMSHTAHLKST